MSSHNPRAILHRPRRVSGGLAGARQGNALSPGTQRSERPGRSSRQGRSGRDRATSSTGSSRSSPDTRPLSGSLAELAAAGLDPVDVIAGRSPARRCGAFVSPWTYVAAQRADDGSDRSWRCFTAPTPGSKSRRIGIVWQQPMVPRSSSHGRGARRGASTWRRTAEVSVIVRPRLSGEVVGLLPTLVEPHVKSIEGLPLRLRYLGLAGAGPGAADHLGPLTTDVAVAGPTVHGELDKSPVANGLLRESVRQVDSDGGSSAQTGRSSAGTTWTGLGQS